MIQLGIGTAIGFVLGSALSPRPEKPLPLSNVPKEKWQAFVGAMACSPTSFKSQTGRLGAFQFAPKRLEDIGLITKAARPISTWRSPFSESSFLTSPKVQYRAFTKSCRYYLPIAIAHKNKIVDGKFVTVSGALGVLHIAGEPGFLSWISDPKVRKKFSNTTNTFNQTNGAF